MRIVRDLEQLSDVFAGFGDRQAETSYALVPVDNDLGTHDVVALRMADKWCDVTIAMATGEVPPESVQAYLEQAGCQVLLALPRQKTPCQVDVGIEKVEGTHFMQGILAVMPSAVVVPIARPLTTRAVIHIEKTFPNLFTRLESETPAHILSGFQKELRSALNIGREIKESGVKEANELLYMVKKGVEQRQLGRIRALSLFDGNTMQPLSKKVSGHMCLYAELENGAGRVVKDAIFLQPVA